MKTKYFLLVAALALFFTACEKQAPFDTQSENDLPRILVPYETKSGELAYTLANDSTPLVDSVVVTPSKYTTVNWYVDDSLVCTGTKINMCFSAGVHDLLIEAVTTVGNKTSRKGTITVLGGPTDPTILWEGPVDIDWNADLVKVTADKFGGVPVGAKICVHFDVPEAEYHSIRITTPNWDADYVAQIDGMDSQPTPLTFVYDDNCKNLVESSGAMCVVGFGLTITKINFKLD